MAHDIRRVLYAIAIVSNSIGTLMVLGLVLVVNTDVVARGAFNTPFRGAVVLTVD